MSVMTIQKKLFARYYISSARFNGERAAIMAGYSEKTAGSQASRLLKDVNVRAFIDKELDRTAKRIDITADRIIQELARIGFSNMMDYVRLTSQGDPLIDLSQLTRDRAAAISKIVIEDYVEGRGEDAREVKRIRFELHDKRAALIDLGKHIGLFRESSLEGDLASIIARSKPAEAKRILLTEFAMGDKEN